MPEGLRFLPESDTEERNGMESAKTFAARREKQP